MTKAELAEAVTEKLNCSKKESCAIVDLVFSLMKDCLEGGEDLKIPGFGKFEVKAKAARRGRNPQTGEAIVISSRRVLSFKPSQVLKGALNDDGA